MQVFLSVSLTSQEVEHHLFEHGFVDLWVGDGVQQPPLLIVGENYLAQLLPVNLPALQQDLRPKVVHDAAVGQTVGLHHCYQGQGRQDFFLIQPSSVESKMMKESLSKNNSALGKCGYGHHGRGLNLTQIYTLQTSHLITEAPHWKTVLWDDNTGQHYFNYILIY